MRDPQTKGEEKEILKQIIDVLERHTHTDSIRVRGTKWNENLLPQTCTLVLKSYFWGVEVGKCDSGWWQWLQLVMLGITKLLLMEAGRTAILKVLGWQTYWHTNWRWIPKMSSFPTSLLQLVVTMITHFGHAVFHVFQWVSVPGAAPTHNLHQTT